MRNAVGEESVLLAHNLARDFEIVLRAGPGSSPATTRSARIREELLVFFAFRAVFDTVA